MSPSAPPPSPAPLKFYLCLYLSSYTSIYTSILSLHPSKIHLSLSTPPPPPKHTHSLSSSPLPSNHHEVVSLPPLPPPHLFLPIPHCISSSKADISIDIGCTHSEDLQCPMLFELVSLFQAGSSVNIPSGNDLLLSFTRSGRIDERKGGNCCKDCSGAVG